jgi:hypothetical protein
MLSKIVIEAETPGDLGTMFRLWVDANVIAEGVTEAQAHLLVGEILQRIGARSSVADPASGRLRGVLAPIVAGLRRDGLWPLLRSCASWLRNAGKKMGGR